MKKLFLLLCLCLNFQAFASQNSQLAKAPTNFDENVYVDFTLAEYSLKYNFQAQKLEVVSRIELNQPIAGHILFDIVPNPSKVILDGVDVELNTIKAPANATSMRQIDKTTEAGIHVLEVHNSVEQNITWNSSGVSSAFWMSDLNDRRYLERYVVSNFEYDQFKANFVVEFEGFPKKQIIYANGDVTEMDENFYLVSYPEYFTASSFYFHTSHEDRFDEVNSVYNSIDGREIPVKVYRAKGDSLNSFMRDALKVLPELEKDYGPFPHPAVVIYGAGMGGMEYCGATMTSLSALGHELHHSYFARGVMPARGNSGWVDEAIASWRDNGYPSRTRTGFRSTTMAGHSNYRRFTDRDAYSKGAKFMAHLHFLLKDQGGLKPFLKQFKDKWLFKPFFTVDFVTDLEEYMNRDLDELFNRYIYGRGKVIEQSLDLENPMHPKLSDEYYKTLL